MANDDEIDFEEQLQQENRAKVEEEEQEAATRGLTYTDDDGTVMEWDPEKRAYFPKIDINFIAQYQMNYGTDFSQTGTGQPPGSTDATAQPNSSSMHDWYNYYSQQGQGGTTDGEGKQEYTAADYHAYYSYYYGEDYMKHFQQGLQEEEDHDHDEEHEEKEKKEEEDDKDQKGGKKKKGKNKGEKRKPPPQPEPVWFDMDEEKSTHVYVSNLPTDITEEEFKEVMNKCGLIMFDPLTHKPKLKLYRNSDGTLKGDGLCCYIKQESVDLALKILDGYDVRGNKLSVERAKFQMKGSFDPTKKKKKLSNKAKRKMKEKQQKLFDWRPDVAPGARFRFERIVILKNMFDCKEFETDPALINELREDVRAECSKFGDVRKVQVHDRHPEGVISVTFKSPEEGDVCVAALHGRWFAKRQISAQTYDGKTRYEVNETEAEKQERLRGWEHFLGDDTNSGAASNQKPKTDAGDNNKTVQISDSGATVPEAGASSGVSDAQSSRESVRTLPAESSGAADAIEASEESSEQ